MSYNASLTNHTSGVYKKNASFVYSSKFTHAVLDLLAAKPGERIADLGCGTGELTMEIKGMVGDEGFVVGIDSSENMLAQAKINTKDQISLTQADIQSLPTTLNPSLKGTFDAVFTSAVLHWAKRDPKGVLEGVRWLLKPGGRFVFEFGGFGNAVGVRSAIHQVLKARGVDPEPLDPFYYPTAEAYKKLLTQSNLTPVSVGLFPRPTPLPGSLTGWLETFVYNTYWAQFNLPEREEMSRQVEDICRVDNYWQDPQDGKEGWEIMYVRCRGVAISE